MIYMLFDNPNDERQMFFLRDSSLNINLIFPKEKSETYYRMFKKCFEMVRHSKKMDTIICWYDFMGIIVWWICRVLKEKRRIVVLNLLLKDKKTLKNIIAKKMYKKALNDPHLIATVTSLYYGEWLNSLLKINKKYFLLHDVYHGNLAGCEDSDGSKANTVFCGGRNGRDWNLIISVANEMPDIKFVFVMGENEYIKYKSSMSSNIRAYRDVSQDYFLKLMNMSTIVAMPLETQAPAGLIAFYQAATCNKLIITSDTVTTREYFLNKRGVLCSNNICEWVNKIRYYLSNKSVAYEMAKQFRQYLENECSEECYLEKLNVLLMSRF